MRYIDRPLAELCEFQRGLTYAKSDEVDQSRSVVLRANNVDLASSKLDLSDLRFISEGVAIPSDKLVRKGSLLICTASGSKSHLGKVAYIDDDYGFAFGGFMGQITPANGVNGRYLYHALTTPAYKNFIASLSDGANINNLKFSDLQRFRVPRPDIEEQDRIVTLLDEAFEGIATAKAHAEQNLRNTREVLALSIDDLFRSLNGGSHPWCSLGELATFRNGINFTKSSKGERVRIIGVKDFQRHFDACIDDLEWVTLDGELSALDCVAAGDIVFVRSNGNPELIGRCMLVGALVEPTVHSGFTIKMRLHDDRLDARFLCHFLKSTAIRRELVDGGNGANIKSLNQGTLAAVRVPTPSKTLQRELVDQIETLENQVGHLTSIYQRKLTALDELKQSLLHQAFTGQF